MNKRLKTAWKVWQYVIKCGPKGATASECAKAIGEPNQSVSPRVSELVRHQLLLRSTIKRPTTDGGVAVVVFANAKAKFEAYAAAVREKQPARKGSLSIRDSAIFRAGQKFVDTWRKCRKPEQQQAAVLSLVRKLQKIAVADLP